MITYVDLKTGERRVEGEPSAEYLLLQERAGMQCSRFQAKAALLSAGLLTAAETAVLNSTDFVKLAWAEAVVFERNSATIKNLAQVLGLSDAEIDDLFRAAMKIVA